MNRDPAAVCIRHIDGCSRLYSKIGTIEDVTLSALAAVGSIAEQRWGLVTAAQAREAGVSRSQLSRWAKHGVVERVARGVYRMAGAPSQLYQDAFASWLALGGATLPKTSTGVPAVIATGKTAAVMHDLGDFLLEEIEFATPTTRSTRIPYVRLRTMTLTPEEITFAQGLPCMTVERTIADLVEEWVDLSHIAGVVNDALTTGRVIWIDQLLDYLDPILANQNRVNAGAKGPRDLLHHLFELAGVFPKVGLNEQVRVLEGH